ncbi:MAG: hypothetical protein KJO07_10290 [Deltaproteobacteria bacterium]|nr:hypothetical protein [Deltaproteobacteria bacterium]
MDSKRFMGACIGARDLLLITATAMLLLGPVAVAVSNPGWHVGTFLGGLELVIFALIALPAGLVLSAVASAPPSRWRPTMAVITRGALLAAMAAPVVMFGFRLIGGLPLAPYRNGICCSASSPSHVMLIAMLVFPATGFLLGTSCAHGIGKLWRQMPDHRSLAIRLVITVAAITAACALLAPLVVTSPATFVTACALVGLIPMVAGDRLLGTATLASLASAVLLGFYL